MASEAIVQPIERTEKRCRKCGEVKPISDFYNCSRSSDGKMSECKVCNYKHHHKSQRAYDSSHRHKTNEARRMREFGLTPKAYDAMLLFQGGVCAICGKPESAIQHRTGKPKLLAIDHDHVTGKVRGLLCQRCNHGLGLFGESVEVMESAVAYLHIHSASVGVSR